MGDEDQNKAPATGKNVTVLDHNQIPGTVLKDKAQQPAAQPASTQAENSNNTQRPITFNASMLYLYQSDQTGVPTGRVRLEVRKHNGDKVGYFTVSTNPKSN